MRESPPGTIIDDDQVTDALPVRKAYRLNFRLAMTNLALGLVAVTIIVAHLSFDLTPFLKLHSVYVPGSQSQPYFLAPTIAESTYVHTAFGILVLFSLLGITSMSIYRRKKWALRVTLMATILLGLLSVRMSIAVFSQHGHSTTIYSNHLPSWRSRGISFKPSQSLAPWAAVPAAVYCLATLVVFSRKRTRDEFLAMTSSSPTAESFPDAVAEPTAEPDTLDSTPPGDD